MPAWQNKVPATHLLGAATDRKLTRVLVQASVASAISFSIGAAIPLLSAAFIKDPMIRWGFRQLPYAPAAQAYLCMPPTLSFYELLGGYATTCRVPHLRLLSSQLC